MYKKTKLLFSIVLCTCIAFSNPLLSYAAPDNTKETADENENKLTISSVDDFLIFSENCRLDSYSKDLNVSLESDIDLTDTDFDSIPIFYGTFNGNNHRIKGLKITSDGSTKGLFRYIESTATVKNLIVEGTISPAGSRSIIGGIAGNNSGLIQNCVFSGTVTGADNIGGLAGINDLNGIIENCKVYGTIHGDHFVGGIAGGNYGVIRNCSNLTKINTTVEENSVEISDITLNSLTSSESAVTTTDIGGITGSNNGVIRNCENHGNIGYQHIGYNIGGISGSNIGYITNGTNYGSILGRKEVGGIVGQMEPASTLDFDADTFQILETQFNTMSVLADRAATNVENNSNISDADLNTLSTELNKARQALGKLQSTDGSYDRDQILAAQNTLAGSLSKIRETSRKIANESPNASDSLSKDLEAISKQAGKISSTLSNASDNLGGSFTDTSDMDTENDTIGEVSDCTNIGYIQADLNIGGIVGAISLESDLDPEEDIEITGNESMNFDYEIRSVIRNCTNQGTIVAKRQYAGGIVGLASLGLVHSCTNTGKIDAAGADYVGGIAGESHGYIRNCNTKCIILASSYVGGVAGLASTVSDCRSMIQINDFTEKAGAVLGYFAEEFSYENNYYLPVKNDIGGIDGISYEQWAKPLKEDEFFALENLPDMFKKQTLRFEFEGGVSKNITIDYGKRIAVADIPSVPKKAGYRGTWEGYEELISSELVFDTTFTTLYTPLSTTTQSRELRNNGAPVLLAEGEFTTDNTIKLSPSQEIPTLTADQTLVEALSYTVPTSNTSVTLRYLPPTGYLADTVTIMVLNNENQWQTVETKIVGSYIVFPVGEDTTVFCSVYTKPDYTMTYIIGGVIGIFVIVVITVIATKKKRKSKLNNTNQ